MLHYTTCRAAAIICRWRAWVVIVVIAWALGAIVWHVWPLNGQLGHCVVIVQAHSSHYLRCAMLYCTICRAAAIIYHGGAWAVIVVIAWALSAILGHVWSSHR